MTRVIVVIAMMLGAATVVPAQAQTPAPTPCPDCAKAGADAAALQKQIAERNAELRELQQEQAINNANLSNLRQLRLDAARSGDTAAVRQHEQSIDDLQSDNRANRDLQSKTREDIQSLNEQIEKLGRNVDACAKQCGAMFQGLPSGTYVNPPTDPPPNPPALDGVGVPPLRLPACDPCRETETATALRREHAELQRRAERANAQKRDSDLRDFEEQRQRVRELQRQVDECGKKQCRPPNVTSSRGTSLTDPRIIGAAGGGAVLVALLAGSDDTPGAVSTPGVSTTQTSPVVPAPAQPAPQPTQPAPPPQPTIAGVHDCAECVAMEDVGRHDGTIRMCDLAGGPWEVAVASITIRHAAPFVNIESAPFDTTSGVFSGTTRGTVAGIPNVGIRFEGVANAQTGRITFTYTLGTGGQLPGGRPITYRIGLQKRP